MNIEEDTLSEVLFACPQWTLFIENGHLFASAGGDETYLLDQLDGAQAEKFLTAYNSGDFERIGREDAVFAKAINHLMEAGALFRGRPAPLPRLTMAIRWSGTPLPALQAAIMEQTGADTWDWTSQDNDADLCLVVRTSGTLAQTSETAADLRIPHLLADLAHNHTLSLGPIVKRGQTACLACMAARISRHWGDMPPPERPEMTERHQFVAAMLALQLQRFQRFGTCPELIERLWSIDTDSFSSRFDTLHRLPWCPQCFPGQNMDEGRIALPWL
jgi:bacteriocin biosynthesis cyclodehydratase domain-containing protein